jgi:hypothetical protein
MMKFTKYFKGNTLLVSIMGAAVLAVILGFLVLRQRINTPFVDDTATTEDSAQEEEKTAEESPSTTAIPSDWKTYTNDKYVFSVKYPPNLQAGAVSKNSVLGTYQVPMRGFHVGPLVFIVLKDAALKDQAVEYFNASYDVALHPQTGGFEGEIPPISCVIDKVGVSFIKSVSCSGEGGFARYAYIKGSDYDVFVDGYSKGYDSQDYGNFTKDTDYINILSTFKFSSSVTAADTTAPSIQVFNITADDSGASPMEINVVSGTIVQITFSVSSSNVSGSGLDFRSSVANSGTIYAGQSKTISFTANESFSFTPYSTSTNTAKNYKIKVTVQ